MTPIALRTGYRLSSPPREISEPGRGRAQSHHAVLECDTPQTEEA
jgi:hypothetical protein